MSPVLAAGIWMLDNEMMFYPAGMVRTDARMLVYRRQAWQSNMIHLHLVGRKPMRSHKKWQTEPVLLHRNTTNHVIS